MLAARPKILLAFNQHVRDHYLPPEEVARLESFADWEWFPCDGGGIYDANTNPEAAAALHARIGGFDGLVVCHGAPPIHDAILAAADKLRFVGELEGDRFASRLDLGALWARGIRTVDVTNASSYPVAEWALGLILLSLRNAGAYFRDILAGNTRPSRESFARMGGRLTGKRVGLIGGGHMGRRLIKLLRPFETEIWVHDPYLPRLCADLAGQCIEPVCCGGLFGAADARDPRHVGRAGVGAAAPRRGLCQCVARGGGGFPGVDRALAARGHCGGAGCL